MWITLLAPLPIEPERGPLAEALAATEAPDSLRAAFTVELRSGEAIRVYRFDPRQPGDAHWRLEKASGDNRELDEIGAAWGAESAPDGRLFPDHLDEALSATLQAEDFGEAWRIVFDHRPQLGGDELDRLAAAHLDAVLWLDPEAGRFLRLDHELPRPVTGTRGVRLLSYRQSHYFQQDPVYELSVVSAISVELEARVGFRRVSRAYEVRLVEVELFFASAAHEAEFLQARMAARKPRR